MRESQLRMSEAGSQNPRYEERPLVEGEIILPNSQQAPSSQGTAFGVQFGPRGEQIMSRGVRSALYLTLGKISIIDERIATEITPPLARQMRKDRDHCVCNNLLVVMADIFRINTTAVSDYGPAMASCLRDPSVLVRKQAVFLITSLIRDEYFKWDGQSMYFYLGALLDPDQSVREQVRASLLNVLLPKSPKMLINRFVEIMFYLNDVTHPNMAVSAQHEKENCPLAADDRFALYGERRAAQRMEIYEFMLSTFSDVENLPLMCRIASEVFENIKEERLVLVGEDGAIDRNVVGLLKDALHIVRSKQIVLTLQTGKKPSSVEDADDENEEARQLQAVAGDAIAHTFLKTLNEEVVNRMWRLRSMLIAKRTPQSLELAKLTHSALLDIYEHYFEHFDKLVGNNSQQRGEVKSDLELHRKRVFPRPQQQNRQPAAA
ncbi:Condensin-2 complex subunit D3 [Aphelenchoides fujianensis]|nr:Condensin-2 complex subunit D3 [Aphelenchoides fujianensis]